MSIGAEERWSGLRARAVSPELVLVCPELRKAELQRLPQRDPDDFLAFAAPSAATGVELARAVVLYTALRVVSLVPRMLGFLAATVAVAMLRELL